MIKYSFYCDKREVNCNICTTSYIFTVWNLQLYFISKLTILIFISDREQRELYEAAKIIQKAYRSYKGRQKLEEQDKERAAAICIQNYYRRYKQVSFSELRFFCRNYDRALSFWALWRVALPPSFITPLVIDTVMLSETLTKGGGSEIQKNTQKSITTILFSTKHKYRIHNANCNNTLNNVLHYLYWGLNKS